MEIGIFEILSRPNFNKFWPFFVLFFLANLGLIGNKYFIKTIFDITWAVNNCLYANELLYLDKLF